MKNLRRLEVADEDLYVSAQERKVLASRGYVEVNDVSANTIADSDSGNNSCATANSKSANDPCVVANQGPTRKLGTLVESTIEITDGIRLVIAPIPSSHVKGSLCVIVNDEYLLIGDAFYCSAKGYNVSLLADEIRCLKELSFTKVIMSHDEKIYSREESISELEGIYGRRSKDDPYVSI